MCLSWSLKKIGWAIKMSFVPLALKANVSNQNFDPKYGQVFPVETVCLFFSFQFKALRLKLYVAIGRTDIRPLFFIQPLASHTEIANF